MSRRLPSLNALRAFEAAARHLSFSRAAAELRVTQGAVSRQVKALETDLGVPLFKRLVRALELTEHGRDLLPTMRDVFDRVEQAATRLRSRRASRVLTANVLPTFAMRWLIPRLPHFATLHPDIEVHMVTSIRPVDFGREDIDVAIRVGTPPGTHARDGAPRIDLETVEDWHNVRADLLMPDVLVPVCAPHITRGDPPLRGPADLLRGRPLLHNATRARAWPDWFKAMGLPRVGAEDGPSYGHFFMVLQAAIEGRGVALVPRALVEGDLTAGTLVIPFPAPVESAGAYYLLCREHQSESERVRRFREWLLSERETASPPRAPGADRKP
jgi:LysR family glycine cleavage system transcriptional activator